MSSTPAGARGGRGKQSAIIVLKLSRSKLAAFPSDKKPSKAGGSKAASSTPSTPGAAKESPGAAAGFDPKDELASNNADDSLANGKKGTPSLKAGAAGVKRGASATADATLKARPRPGPKRRKM